MLASRPDGERRKYANHPMKPVVVLNVVGLTNRQIGPHTPHLQRLAQAGCAAPMTALLPGVTCAAQATMLTGTLPSEHGAVGNGWYFEDVGEVHFWRQSNACVRGPKLYERARELDPSFTCAKLFWWWNMGAAVDFSITPRPFYPADGRKFLAVYGWPKAYPAELEQRLGPFPFFDFWGPKAGLGSSRWITDAALDTLERQAPALTLVYLPHLDYDHQRFGPEAPQSLQALEDVDALVGELCAGAERIGAEVVVVSEYGIESVDRPVALNRILRTAGLLEVRESPTGELLDVFASAAFAVCDHQVAHVYVRDSARVAEVRELLERQPGVASVLGAAEQPAAGIAHPRSGQLVAVASKGAWFEYGYWLDDAKAPDFARTVDIHRKPGYDPCELFVDPELKLPMLRVARRLAAKKAGFRYLMDVIPLDAKLVRGSHGRLPEDPDDGPVFLASQPFDACGGAPSGGSVAMTSVPDRILELLQRR